MVATLLICSIFAGLAGLGLWSVGQSAIHEILASVFLLISAVFFSACLIVNAIQSLENKVLAEMAGPSDDVEKEKEELT